MNEDNNITLNRHLGLSGFILKIIALITMTCDHVGYMLFPELIIFRIIGRIAFPIFAYFMAIGSVYSKKPLKRLLQIFILGVVCEVVYIIYDGAWYGNILLTFSCSALLIYILRTFENLLYDKNLLYILFAVLFIISFSVIYYIDYAFGVDYGFIGIMLPVIVSIPYLKCLDKKINKSNILNATLLSKILFIIGLVILVINDSKIMMYSLITIPLILLYNGTPGKIKLKYFFYLYYPIHMLIIAGISMIL